MCCSEEQCCATEHQFLQEVYLDNAASQGASPDVLTIVLGLSLLCQEESFAAVHSPLLSSWSASPDTLANVLGRCMLRREA